MNIMEIMMKSMTFSMIPSRCVTFVGEFRPGQDFWKPLTEV